VYIRCSGLVNEVDFSIIRLVGHVVRGDGHQVGV
jgi:hypothetical protein